MTDRYIGMLSGTSRDGVDLVLTRFEGNHPVIEQSLCLPYPQDLAALLEQMITTAQRPLDEEMQRADKALADFFSLAVGCLLQQANVNAESITAIGSHGQTVWHEPPESIQLGNPQQIALTTGITTVGHFRQADLAAGGQGAPLAPLLHRAIFQPETGTRLVLNLGGIANISVVSADGAVSGFDTGPANCLLDGWIRQYRGKDYDENGEWAATGSVDSLLLLDLLTDPYFKKPPPKSTGVEVFNLGWLRSRKRLNSLRPVDVQATLAQLTASSIASAITAYQADEILVCGGGVHNSDLLRRLQHLMPDCVIRSTGDAGLDPDCVEAVLFAWLARSRLERKTMDSRAITGAETTLLLGDVFRPGRFDN